MRRKFLFYFLLYFLILFCQLEFDKTSYVFSLLFVVCKSHKIRTNALHEGCGSNLVIYPAKVCQKSSLQNY